MARKLLLADDSITIQKVVELILEEEDFEIKSVSNGEEALSLVPAYRPDVVLADIEMPKMNGYQLCEKIKQNPATKAIPVVLLTGAFEPIDEELARRVGADDFIIKPFESYELINKVNAAVALSVVSESAEPLVEAEAIASDEETLDDLWAMEEIPEVQEPTSWPVEEAASASAEELIEIAEDIEPVPEEAIVSPGKISAQMPSSSAGMLTKEEIIRIVEAAFAEKLASIDLKETVLSALAPMLKDSIEKILWEVTPDLIEKVLKAMIAETLGSLRKDIEKVMWETVPDLAETMVAKEIERIRSEF